MQVEDSGDDIKYLELSGLSVQTKVNTPKMPKPPKVRGKHYSNFEYLADSTLLNLTPDLPKEFPGYTYDANQDSSYFEQCFTLVHKLGEGSFGSVLQVIDLADNKFYAVKVSKEPFRNDSDKRRKLKEVMYHEQFAYHPNIVRLHSAWEEDRYLYMQMELCKGNMCKYDPMPESDVWKVLADMICAVYEIHEAGMAHFDIKLENILEGYDGRYKLSDFGLVYNFVQDRKWNPSEGDAKYLAPELLGTQANFSSKADIFSLGVCILELAANIELPSNGDVWKALRENTFPYAHTRHLSEDLFGLIRSMMSQDHSVRPSASDILSIPKVQDILAERSSQLANPTITVQPNVDNLKPYMAVWACLSSLVHLTAKNIELGVTSPKSTSDESSMVTDNSCEVTDNSSEMTDVSSSAVPELPHPPSFCTSTPAQPNKGAASSLMSDNAESNWKQSGSFTDSFKMGSWDEQQQMEEGDEGISQLKSIGDDPNNMIFKVSSPEEASGFSLPTDWSSLHINSPDTDESSMPQSPLSHIFPLRSLDIDMEQCREGLTYSSPSIFKYGVATVKMSDGLKDIVKAKRMRRTMLPRNLKHTFDEEDDTEEK